MSATDIPIDESMERSIDGFLKKSPRPVLHGAVILQDETRTFLRGVPASTQAPVFEIGSVGKVFTTTLLAMLVREGCVALDDPVARFRPQYPFAGTVMLADLACHASGLPANPAGAWAMMTRAQKVTAGSTPADLEAFLTRQPEKSRRSGRFSYSNAGMALLGHILADCLGVPYERAIRERILDPLQMADTRIDPAHYPAERLLSGHGPGGRAVPPLAWPGLEPAGLWRSTVADMTCFLQAQLGMHGALWAELAGVTTKPRLKVGPEISIGLGWMLSPLDGCGVYAWHSGGTLGQTSMVAWSPDTGTA
ncbi:MAG: serine hydrolase domain-containing protein, partial [Wenzhouxiangellaceae bacterium]